METIQNLITPMDSEPEPIPESKICRDCGNQFTPPPERLFFNFRCSDCWKIADAKQEREETERTERQLTNQWEKLCPISFLSTDKSLLPCQSALEKVLKWSFADKGRGLILNGPTRLGKTRSAWLTLKPQHFRGLSIEVMDSLSGLAYAGMFGDSAKEAERWVKKKISADILLMDDIFKAKLTDSFEGAVFAIVDHRTAEGGPIIITSNDTGQSLTKRMTEDRGEPMVARLREFCDIITFKL